MLKYFSYTIVFQEIPDEISLCFEITGCPLRCKGCHSPHLRNHKLGQPLTEEHLKVFLQQYKDFVTTVLFFGGDWEEESLINCLKSIRDEGLKTALYTGAEDVSDKLKENLTYLKTGPYIEELGDLTSPKTNQRLTNLATGEDIHVYRPHRGTERE